MILTLRALKLVALKLVALKLRETDTWALDLRDTET